MPSFPIPKLSDRKFKKFQCLLQAAQVRALHATHHWFIDIWHSLSLRLLSAMRQEQSYCRGACCAWHRVAGSDRGANGVEKLLRLLQSELCPHGLPQKRVHHPCRQVVSIVLLGLWTKA